MKFCIHCGKELVQEATFCPHCGGSLTPSVPEVLPQKPRMDGGTRGKGIASLVLGVESLGVSVGGLFFLVFQVIFSALPGEAAFVGAIFWIYVVIFGLIGLGCGIAGRILGKKSLEKAPEFKLPKIGVPLSLSAIIGGGAAIALGFLFLVINAARW